ncbi:MAG: hypothetical protein ACLQAT_20230 [Candidatus Binataceae bacterium]
MIRAGESAADHQARQKREVSSQETLSIPARFYRSTMTPRELSEFAQLGASVAEYQDQIIELD